MKRYSSGMYVRLAFAVAAHLEPEMLLVDEVLAVGDAEFQRAARADGGRSGQSGRTVLFVSHNMQADRAAVRPRDPAHGRPDRQATVRAPAIVAHYLRAGDARCRPEHVWDDPTDAPGDDLVRLRSIRVVDENGEVMSTADVRNPVGIEIGFSVLRHGMPIVPKIKVVDRHGAICFNAMDGSTRGGTIRRPAGAYSSTAWIPANLLNEGRHASTSRS